MPTDNDFTIATYNILFAINREEILGNIFQMAKEGVSVLCLQEIINVTGEEFIINAILKKLGNQWQASYHVGPEFSRQSIGTAILWNKKVLKLKKEEKILLPKIKAFDFREKLFYKAIGATPVPLQRKTISCDFSFGNTPIRITCIHLDNVGGPQNRKEQFTYLLSQLRTKENIDHEILCGDFNTFDFLKTGYEKKLLQKNLGIDFVEASKQITWTADLYHTDLRTSIKGFRWIIKDLHTHLKRKLDYIWVKSFSVTDCYKLNLPGSDHFPVIAKLKMQQSEKER